MTQGNKEKELLKNFFVNNELRVGWVVDYESFSSNVIKFSTQSIFSHINFFDRSSCMALGAEDLRWVVVIDYKKWKNRDFYYFAKKIDFEKITNFFDFDYIMNVFLNIGKLNYKQKKNFEEKFYQYVGLRQKYSKEELFELLYPRDFEYQDFEYPSKWENYDYKLCLKEFLILGVIKFMKKNLWKDYDLWSTLGIGFTPWKTSSFDSQTPYFFCSELVAEALLYAWIYPFDIKTKDPNSITPWDLMDLSHIYKDFEGVLYKIDKNWIHELLNLSENWNYVSIKDFILARQIQNFRVRFDYVKVSLLKRIMKKTLSWKSWINIWKYLSAFVFVFFVYWLFYFLTSEHNPETFLNDIMYAGGVNYEHIMWFLGWYLLFLFIFVLAALVVFYLISLIVAIFNKKEIIWRFIEQK